MIIIRKFEKEKESSAGTFLHLMIYHTIMHIPEEISFLYDTTGQPSHLFHSLAVLRKELQ